MTALIDAETTVGLVSLAVADLEHSQAFYTGLGFEMLDSAEDWLVLGSDARPLVKLYGVPEAKRVVRAAGLYHMALRLPSRTDLARLLLHFSETQTPIQGLADHHVSEAIYLSDPDGHGIEIYADRPRESWYDPNGKLYLVTEPLDVQNLIEELPAHPLPWASLPSGSDMGHIHLHIADLVAARRFYVDGLGFEIVAQMPSALFISTAGYHHHIGLNTWAGVGVPPAPDGSAKLLSYELVLPSLAVQSDVLTRLDDLGYSYQTQPDQFVVQDPSGNSIRLKLAQ